MDIGERLKEIREVKGLNQKEFATFLGIEPSKYNKYEKNVTRPDYETLILISKSCNVSIDYILGNEIKESPKLTKCQTDLLDTLNKINSEYERIKALARFEDIVKNMIAEASNELALTTELASNKKRA